MMKKLLLVLFIFLSVYIANGQQIDIITTSTSDAWSPERVDKTGLILHWVATGSGLSDGPLTVDANDPIFNFENNDGSPINITVTSSDGLSGLTRLYLWTLEITDLDVSTVTDLTRLEPRDNQLTSLDVTQNTALTGLDVRFNNLSTIDVTQNTALTRLVVRENNLLSSLDVTNNPELTYLHLALTQVTSIDISANPLLDYFQAAVVPITALDIANNPLLDFVRVNSAQLTSGELDQLVNTLDAFGITDGNLQIRRNPESLTAASQPSYDNLITKGWTIDVKAPPTPSVETIVLTTTSRSNAWSPGVIINEGDVLKWKVEGGVTIPEETIDDPTFDLSGNTGTATITITSDFGFWGLTQLNFVNDDGNSSEITTIDVSNGGDLERLDLRTNSLTSLDVSQNTALTRLVVRLNPALTTLDLSANTQLENLQIASTQISSIDLSNNPLLDYFRADVTPLTALDISSNPLLDYVKINSAQLSSGALDQLVNTLDVFGLVDGNLQIRNNPGSLTAAAQPSYDNLIGKNWTIDVSAPPAPSVETIVLTTTSKSNAWSPAVIINNGSTLKWSVSGGVTIPEEEIDDPTFDLSGNTGTATITITSDFGFWGLTQLNFVNDDGNSSEITTIDVSNGGDLERLDLRINNLTSLDVSQNTVLTRLLVRDNASLSVLDVSANTQLTYLHIAATQISTIDLTNNPLLDYFRAAVAPLTTLDISNNPLLDYVRVNDAQLPSGDLDQLVNDLDAFGLSDGNLEIRNNPGSLTSAAQPAYDNLIGKNWTIDVPAPPVASVETIVLTTTSKSNAWSPAVIINNGSTLKWTVSGGVTIPEETIDDPTFDLSGNTGTATITITSDFGFWGLTQLNFVNDDGNSSEIATIDVTKGGDLERLDLRTNNLTVLDVSQNTALTRLVLRQNAALVALDITNNSQLTNLQIASTQISTIDLTNNPLLNYFRADVTQLTALDISNNPLLDYVRVNDAQLTSGELDQLVNELDAFGLSDGNLEVRNNPGSLTVNAQPSYDNLITKNWTIDVPAPPVPSVETIVLTTTSKSNAWSPAVIINGGSTLKWKVEGGVTIPEETIDDPTFDLSGNTGIATITITSDFGFFGLTQLNFVNDDGNSSEITTIDVTNGGDLERLDLRTNNLTVLDVSQNTALTRLILRQNVALAALDVTNNSQLTNLQIASTQISVIDLSNNPLLNYFRADVTQLTALDISNNPLLDYVRVNDAQLTSGELDQLVNELDAFGLSDGNLEVRNNSGSLTANAQPSYDNLIGKNWTIDVPAPPVASVETIVLTTTSKSNAWSPAVIINNGSTLKWTVSGGVTIPEETIDDPTFDLSGNTGIATITITSDFGFFGLTQLNFVNDDGNSSEIATIDVTNGGDLERLDLRTNNLTVLDVSQNTALTRLILRQNVALLALDVTNNSQLSNLQIASTQISIIDLSNNPLLDYFRADVTQLTALDISNNPLLDYVRVNDAQLTSGELDQLVNELDAFGLSDGNLEIRNNPGSLTATAQPSYDNLIIKNWTIDVPAPPVPSIETIVLTTTSKSNAWSPAVIINDGSTLKWKVEGGVTIPEETIDDPTFDLSGNTGIATITITSDFGFFGLTQLNFVNDDGNSSEIATIDVSNGGDLERLDLRLNNLASLDVSQNTALTRLVVRDNAALSTLDITNNTQLTYLHIASTQISTIDLSNNPLLDYFQAALAPLTTLDITNNPLLDFVRVNNAQLPSGVLDQLVNDLDAFGLTDGNLQIRNNPGSLTTAAQPSYDNLIIKNWTIDVNAPGPVINVIGNGNSIVNGDTTPDVADDTDFGPVQNNTSKTTTFTIQNDGDSNLIVTGISFLFGSSNTFSFDNLPAFPATILPGDNIPLDVIFFPTATANYGAFIQIDHNDDAQDPFQYAIGGQGADVVVTGDIMISQYYSGFEIDDKWIEVKNISGMILDPADTQYYLAMYDQSDVPEINSKSPTVSIAIPLMQVDGVLLFKNPNSPALPSAGNIGGATQISTNVCTFNGNDVILISTSDDITCYGNRQDIIGTTDGTVWGDDRCYIKGGCASESAHADYLVSDWIAVLLNNVDNADPNRNVALGTQVVGPTEFNGVSWSNLEPDQSREVVVTQSFSGAGQSIEACNITINSGVDVVFDSNGATKHSIVDYGDLIVNGTLTIGDTESLVTFDPNANLGIITKIEKSTALVDIHDVTYWTSPVAGTQISTVFAGVDPSRIFELDPPNVNPQWMGTEFEFWHVASGAMAEAKGYSIEGSSTGIQTLTYTGVPNNGNYSRELYYKGSPDTGSESENFNFIGNPYPTAIDIEKFLLNNNAANEIYLWTHATVNTGNQYSPADYITYNLAGSSDGVTKNIGSSQGFMLRSTGNAFALFSNDFKLVDQNDQFYKSSGAKDKGIADKDEKNRFWLRMTDVNGVRDNMLIAFLGEATDGLDARYDSYYYYENKNNKDVNFYSNLNGEKLSIQSLGLFKDDKEISLGFDTKITSSLKIGITKTEGAMRGNGIYLVDNLLNITHDLKKSDYEFEQSATGEFPDRFKLYFVATGAVLGDELVLNEGDFIVSNQDSSLKISSSGTVKSIRVYDIFGRKLIDKRPNSNSFELQTTTIKVGTVLLIQATLENGSIINRKTIKY